MPPSWRRRAGRHLPLLAVLLWLPTTGAALWWASRPPAGDDDPRVCLDLQPDEHATLQRTMRHNVEAIDAILRAWGEGDRAGMAAAARTVPANPPGEATPSLRAVLPPAWTALGGTVHVELEAFAAEAESGAPDAALAARLSRVTTACVACHQQFRYRRVGG